MDLDLGSKMIIFVSILTSFEVPIFEAAGEVAKVGLSLKWNHHKQG
jgi:hypothetical protein